MVADVLRVHSWRRSRWERYGVWGMPYAVGYLAALSAGFFLFCTAPLDAPLGADLFAVRAEGVQAEYDGTRDRIVLTWRAPRRDDVFNYRITRYTDTLDGGVARNPVSWFAGPFDVQDTLRYEDTPDLVRTNYWYYLEPVRMVDNGELLVGLPSDTVSVFGGYGVSFSINDNATETPVRDVELVVRDRFNQLARVSFTSRMAAGAPLFGFAQNSDPDNYANRTVGMGGESVRRVPWKLPVGPGNKTVFARFEFTDAAGGRIDTSRTEIGIASWEYRIRIANRRKVLNDVMNSDDSIGYRTGPHDATVLYSERYPDAFTVEDEFTFVAPEIVFNVSIGTDSTVERVFEYWLLFAREEARISFSEYGAGAADTVRHWFETNRRRGELTGRRSVLEHDFETEYRYSVDTMDVQGRQNLSALTRCISNEGYPSVARGAPLTDLAVNARIFRGLKHNLLVSAGRKEVVLVLRFKGKHFGEDRYIATHARVIPPRGSGGGAVLQEQRITTLYFDFYTPRIAFPDRADPRYLNNGDTVSGDLSVWLLRDGSVADGGNSRIAEVGLIVAKKPAGFSWDYRSWNAVHDVPQVTLADLKQGNYRLFPFDPGRLSKGLSEVSWEGIRIDSWSSGQYLVGIYAADEYGNAGLAPAAFQIQTGQPPRTNPFEITILSGK